ncbi:hypothetical protein AMECASPLE_035792 [Ameca splendens]|uniref:Uncharacterized protein n=1 Tax=Ameca splendens TaxID=208324 RepID=A0ABV0XKL1_9TELE
MPADRLPQSEGESSVPRSQSGGVFMMDRSRRSYPEEVLTRIILIMLFPNVSKLVISSTIQSFFTFPKVRIPTKEQVYKTRKRRRPMLRRAGRDIMKPTSSIRIPLAHWKNGRTLMIRANRSTGMRVKLTKYFCSTSDNKQT